MVHTDTAGTVADAGGKRPARTGRVPNELDTPGFAGVWEQLQLQENRQDGEREALQGVVTTCGGADAGSSPHDNVNIGDPC